MRNKKSKKPKQVRTREQEAGWVTHVRLLRAAGNIRGLRQVMYHLVRMRPTVRTQRLWLLAKLTYLAEMLAPRPSEPWSPGQRASPAIVRLPTMSRVVVSGRLRGLRYVATLAGSWDPVELRRSVKQFQRARSHNRGAQRVGRAQRRAEAFAVLTE